MRFAGSAPITDFLAKSMDHGATAQAAAKTRSAVNRAGVEAQGQTAAFGIKGAGEVEAASIIGAAQQSVANAQGQAAIMQGIGKIGGAAIGAFGSAGSSAAAPMSSGLDYSPSSWNKMSEAVGTPNYNITPPINFFN